MSERSDRKVYKDMDVNKNLIIERWRFMEHKKYLIYDLDKCVGCSLCYVVCPERAISIDVQDPELVDKYIAELESIVDVEDQSLKMKT